MTLILHQLIQRIASVDVENDGYIKKDKKTAQFDSDYERMMAERRDWKWGDEDGGQGL